MTKARQMSLDSKNVAMNGQWKQNIVSTVLVWVCSKAVRSHHVCTTPPTLLHHGQSVRSHPVYTTQPTFLHHGQSLSGHACMHYTTNTATPWSLPVRSHPVYTTPPTLLHHGHSLSDHVLHHTHSQSVTGHILHNTHSQLCSHLQ